MKRYIIIMLTLLSFSCTKEDSKEESGPYWKEVERKNKYFNKILNDSSGNTVLYKDFDVWNLKPTKKLTKYYRGLDFPIIEVKSDSNQFSELIIHSDYYNSDTIFTIKENNVLVMNKSTHCCGLYSATTGVYSAKILFLKDKIEVYVDDLLQGDDYNSHWARATLGKNNKSLFYLMDSVWVFDQNIVSSSNRILSEYRTRKILNTTDTNVFIYEEGMAYEYYKANDRTRYLLNNFQDETASYPNEIIFPSLQRKISVHSRTIYSQHDSYFWLIWDLWLSKTGKLCFCHMN